MNKKKVNEYIPYAYEAIRNVGISKNGVVEKTFRSQISSFGAAVVMGSLLSAVAFFSEQGSASVDRTKLLDAIAEVLKKNVSGFENNKTLRNYAMDMQGKGLENEAKENIINAAIAVKLAMNLYSLQSSNSGSKGA